MFQTHDLGGSFGVLVTGIDLSEPQPRETLRELVKTFHDHRAMVIRGQKLDPSRFEWFGEVLGRPVPHFLEDGRLEGHPTITFLTNRTEMRPTVPVNGAMFWHTDQSYEEEPASATMLYAVKLPGKPSGTLVADMYRAYEALDAEMKERIDDLQVIHVYGNRDENKPGEVKAPVPQTEAGRAHVKEVVHPLVMRHPVTGRKALYGVSGSSRRIIGMSEEDGMQLLSELKAHATKREFVIEIPCQIGDISIWDNLATMHSAPPLEPAIDEATTRLMHRISVKGMSPYL